MTTRIDISKKWEKSFSESVFIPLSIHCTLKYDNRSSDMNFHGVLGSEGERTEKECMRLL